MAGNSSFRKVATGHHKPYSGLLRAAIVKRSGMNSGRNFRVARDPGAIRKSPSTSRLPGTNLLDEWIGDLPLIAEVVASQLAKITCPTGRQYIESRFQRQSASPGP